MKRRLSVFMAAVVTVMALFISVPSVSINAAAVGFTQTDFKPRTKAPTKSEKKTYWSYKYNSPQCTWYAYGRAAELLGEQPVKGSLSGNAEDWYTINKERQYYKYGSTPRLGAIACWSGYYGHVAVVEAINSNSIEITEGNNNKRQFFSRSIKLADIDDASNLKEENGTFHKRTFQGYIYIDQPITETTMYVKNTDGSLAINSKAKAGYEIGSIPEGAAVTVYPPKGSGKWYYVNYNGITGYAYGSYLTTTKPATADKTTNAAEPPKTMYVKGISSLTINKFPLTVVVSSAGTIPEGASCTVYPSKSIGKMFYVSYNNISGYVDSSYLSGTKPTPPASELTTKTMYVVNTDGYLAINRTASTKNQIGSIPEGEACIVYPDKKSGNWYYVEYNGVSGYAYSKYLTTIAPEPVPVPEPEPEPTPEPTPAPAPATTAATTSADTYQGRVTGTDGSLVINSKPKAGYDIGYIPEGAYCTVYRGKNSGNWYYVSYNGITGYAYGKYISEVSYETPTPTPAPSTTAATTSANTYQGKVTGTDGSLVINSKPKAGYDIGYIPEGAYCTVYRGKNSGNWYYVSYNGVTGYAYGKYIK